MKALVYYFSGTGNTKRLAELYASALEDQGYAVTLRDVCDKDRSPADAADFDIIGIGYPIHAFNAPKIILKLCKALPKCPKKSRKPVFIFKTSGEPVRMSDVSSLRMRKILKRRGYGVNNEYQYIMPYNIIFRHKDSDAFKMLNTAKALVPIDVCEILNGKTHLPAKMFMGGFLAFLLRIEHGGAHIIGKTFKTANECVDCEMCVKRCPVGNIRKNKKGKIKFGGHCMICMRCVFDCPKNAINAGVLNGWKVNGKYTFEPPESEEPPTKHDDYCKKAYDRYYKQAQKKIASNKPEQ